MKNAFFERNIKFWCENALTSISISLLGFVIASLASASITKLNVLLIYIGTLITLWGAWSAKLAVDKKPNVISIKKVLIFAFVSVLPLFGLVLI